MDVAGIVFVSLASAIVVGATVRLGRKYIERRREIMRKRRLRVAADARMQRLARRKPVQKPQWKVRHLLSA